MLKKIFYKLRGWWQKDELYDSFRHRRGGKWVMGYHDWKRLDKLIKTHQPKMILELGTGIGGSTACMARALQGKALIHTVEQLDKCVRLAQELIPKEYISSIRFYRADIKIVNFPEIPYHYFIQYEKLPEGEWDLIVVDGPWLKFENNKLVDLPASDILAIFPKIKKGCLIYLDGRVRLKSIIKRYYSAYLDVEEEEEEDIFTVWRRNSKPFGGLEDALFKKIKAHGYFDA